VAQIRQGPGPAVAGPDENKTRTPIFLRNDQATTPHPKKSGPEYIYKAPQKILAKI